MMVILKSQENIKQMRSNRDSNETGYSERGLHAAKVTEMSSGDGWGGEIGLEQSDTMYAISLVNPKTPVGKDTSQFIIF